MPTALGTRRSIVYLPKDPAVVLDERWEGVAVSPALWTTVDTESKLTASGGQLRCAGGKATPAWGDPLIKGVRSYTRRAGLTFEVDILGTGATMQMVFGLYDPTGVNYEAIVQFSNSTNLQAKAGAASTLMANLAVVSGTLYRCKVVCNAAGSRFLIQGGAYGQVGSNVWTLWATSTLGSGDVLPQIDSRNAIWSSDYIRVRQDTFKAPLANVASVAAITPTLGAELLTNGTFAAWTGDNPDNWIVSVEDANNYVTEAAGKARLVSNASYSGIRQGTLTTNQWYLVRVDVVTVVSGALRVTQYGLVDYGTYSTAGMTTDVFRATGTNALQLQLQSPGDLTIDDASLKVITLSSCLGSDGGDFGVSDYVASINPTLTAGTQYGMMLNVDSAASPANFILAYHDGTNAQLLKCVAGTYTSLIDAAAAYSAGATLRVIKIGTSVSLYYNNVQIGTTQTVSDAGVVSNTKHYPFSTYVSNSGANFKVEAA